MDKTEQVISPLKRHIAIIKYKCPCFRLCEVKRLNFHLNTIETGANDRDIFVRLIVNKGLLFARIFKGGNVRDNNRSQYIYRYW